MTHKQANKKRKRRFDREKLLFFERKIKKPISSSLKLYEDSILQTGNWSLDDTTGIINTALTGTLTADFEFDVPVRFDTDQMDLSIENYGASSWGSIPLIEVRL